MLIFKSFLLSFVFVLLVGWFLFDSFLLIFTKNTYIYIRESGWERGREWKKQRCGRDTLLGCYPLTAPIEVGMCSWLQPRHMPLTGIEMPSLGVQSDALTSEQHQLGLSGVFYFRGERILGGCFYFMWKCCCIYYSFWLLCFIFTE